MQIKRRKIHAFCSNRLLKFVFWYTIPKKGKGRIMMGKTKRKLYNAEKLENFRELVKRYETQYADKVAFMYKLQPKDTNIVRVTYRQFVEDIRHLATVLLMMGLRKKRVAIIAPNRYEWCVSYLAVTTADMIVVPLDKALPENEIDNLIKRSEADAVIFSKEYAYTFKKIKEEGNSKLEYYICMDDIEELGMYAYSSLLEKGKELIENGDTAYDNIEIDKNEMAVMLFTSGTTSTSKAVALSQANICEDMYALAQMAKVTKEDTFLSFLPLHHTFESSCTFLYGTSCGITVAFCDGIRYVQDNLKEYQVTGFVSVPLMLEIMYKKIQKGIEQQGKTKLVKTMSGIANGLQQVGIDIRRSVFKEILDQFGGKLRILIAGGAPMSKEAIQGFLNLGINLLQGYGLTETSPVLAGENDKYKRLGSVGFPLPGIDVKIDNPNEEGIGEILAKGPTIMLGYHENKTANQEVFTEDGWFRTGDLGYMDKDGFLFITGRKKDVIVLKNGKNIFPEELEMLVNDLPYVAESMIFSRKTEDRDDKLGIKIVYNKEAVKESFPDISKEELHATIWEDIKEKVNKKIPAYKAIRELIVTDIPLIKTTTQKIKRFEELKRILGD